MKAVRYSAASVFLVISIASIIYFDWILKQVMFLSPDRVLVPLMRIQFQIVLVSMGGIGLALMFSEFIVRFLSFIDRHIAGITTRNFLLYTAVTGVVLRLMAVILIPFNLFYDYKGYDEYGWEWALKGGYYRGEHLTAFWPPGYPFILSRIYLLFGHVPQAAAYANVLLGILIPLLSYLIVRKVWNENVARWTALILVLFPSQVLFTHLLASEFLFTPLFLLSIWLFLSFDRKLTGRWYKIFAGGIILGLATLTRVISKFLLVLVIPFWLWETRDIKRTTKYGILAVVGFLLAVVPWVIRNHYAVGTAKINTNTGINLFIGNQPMSGMGYQRYLADEFDGQNPLQEAYTDSVSWERAWNYIIDNPGVFLYRGVLKVGYFYASDVDPVWYGLIEAAEKPETNHAVFLGVLAQSYWFLVLMAALWGLMVFLRSGPSIRNPGGLLLLAIILYWTAVHFVFYGMGRYHFPIIPMISAFAALYIKSIVDNYRLRH